MTQSGLIAHLLQPFRLQETDPNVLFMKRFLRKLHLETDAFWVFVTSVQ